MTPPSTSFAPSRNQIEYASLYKAYIVITDSICITNHALNYQVETWQEVSDQQVETTNYTYVLLWHLAVRISMEMEIGQVRNKRASWSCFAFSMAFSNLYLIFFPFFSLYIFPGCTFQEETFSIKCPKHKVSRWIGFAHSKGHLWSKRHVHCTMNFSVLVTFYHLYNNSKEWN